MFDKSGKQILPRVNISMDNTLQSLNPKITQLTNNNIVVAHQNTMSDDAKRQELNFIESLAATSVSYQMDYSYGTKQAKSDPLFEATGLENYCQTWQSLYMPSPYTVTASECQAILSDILNREGYYCDPVSNQDRIDPDITDEQRVLQMVKNGNKFQHTQMVNIML